MVEVIGYPMVSVVCFCSVRVSPSGLKPASLAAKPLF